MLQTVQRRGEPVLADVTRDGEHNTTVNTTRETPVKGKGGKGPSTPRSLASTMSNFLALLSPLPAEGEGEGEGEGMAVRKDGGGDENDENANGEMMMRGGGKKDGDAEHMVAVLSTRVGDLQSEVNALLGAEKRADDAEARASGLEDSLAKAKGDKAKYKEMARALKNELQLLKGAIKKQVAKGVESATQELKGEVRREREEREKGQREAEAMEKELLGKVASLEEANRNLEDTLETLRRDGGNAIQIAASKEEEADRLRAQLAETRAAFDTFAEAQAKESEALHEQMFGSTALALKLSFSMAGTLVGNVSTADLYQQAKEESVPVAQWGAWISSKMMEAS